LVTKTNKQTNKNPKYNGHIKSRKHVIDSMSKPVRQYVPIEYKHEHYYSGFSFHD